MHRRRRNLALVLLAAAVAGVLWWTWRPPAPPPPPPEPAAPAPRKPKRPAPAWADLPVQAQGDTAPDPGEGARRVRVTVVDADGASRTDGVVAWSDDCGVRGAVGPSGWVFATDADACTVRARRPSGVLVAISPSVRVETDPDVEAEVVLVLSTEPVAGVGIGFDRAGLDLVVGAVWPDSPAARAGVVAGDRVVSIDGHAARDLDDDEVTQALTGPAGSVVRLALVAPDDTAAQVEFLDLVRAALKPLDHDQP